MRCIPPIQSSPGKTAKVHGPALPRLHRSPAAEIGPENQGRPQRSLVYGESILPETRTITMDSSSEAAGIISSRRASRGLSKVE